MKLFLESGAVSIVLFIILAIIGMVSAVEKMKKEAKNPNADLKNNTDKMLFVINEVKNTIKGDSDKKSKDEIAEEDEEEAFWNKAVKKAKDAKVLEREVKAKAAFVKEYDGEHQDFRSWPRLGSYQAFGLTDLGRCPRRGLCQAFGLLNFRANGAMTSQPGAKPQVFYRPPTIRANGPVYRYRHASIARQGPA